jgi:hypothetical protein
MTNREQRRLRLCRRALKALDAVAAVVAAAEAGDITLAHQRERVLDAAMVALAEIFAQLRQTSKKDRPPKQAR